MLLVKSVYTWPVPTLGDGYLGIGNDAAGRIGNGSHESCKIALRKSCARTKQQAEQHVAPRRFGTYSFPLYDVKRRLGRNLSFQVRRSQSKSKPFHCATCLFECPGVIYSSWTRGSRYLIRIGSLWKLLVLARSLASALVRPRRTTGKPNTSMPGSAPRAIGRSPTTTARPAWAAPSFALPPRTP